MNSFESQLAREREALERRRRLNELAKQGEAERAEAARLRREEILPKLIKAMRQSAKQTSAMLVELGVEADLFKAGRSVEDAPLWSLTMTSSSSSKTSIGSNKDEFLTTRLETIGGLALDTQGTVLAYNATHNYQAGPIVRSVHARNAEDNEMLDSCSPAFSQDDPNYHTAVLNEWTYKLRLMINR